MATVQRNRAASWWNPSAWISGGIVALLVMSWGKRLAFFGGLMLAVMGAMSLAGHAFNGWSFHLWGSRGLPVSAAERAPLFAQAWAANDRAGMARFIQPADQAKLQTWLDANSVPSSVASMTPSERKIKTVSVKKDDLDGAIIKVQIAAQATADDSKASGGYTQLQTWAYSGGQWFFSPVASPVAPAAQQAAASRPTNPRSNVATYSTARPAMPTNSDDDDDRPHLQQRPRFSGNVVVPSTVPPWARAR